MTESRENVRRRQFRDRAAETQKPATQLSRLCIIQGCLNLAGRHEPVPSPRCAERAANAPTENTSDQRRRPARDTGVENLAASRAGAHPTRPDEVGPAPPWASDVPNPNREQGECLSQERSSLMIVIPAPPGSQVASYDTDEDGGRQLVWRSICAVILSDQLANAGQLTHAVPTAGGPIVAMGPGTAWVHWGETTP